MIIIIRNNNRIKHLPHQNNAPVRVWGGVGVEGGRFALM